MIEIIEQDFSLDEMIKKAKRTDAGAVVTFLGTVRDDGIEMMELESFRGICTAGAGEHSWRGCGPLRPEVGGDRPPHRSPVCGRQHRGHCLLGCAPGRGLSGMQIHH